MELQELETKERGEEKSEEGNIQTNEFVTLPENALGKYVCLGCSKEAIIFKENNPFIDSIHLEWLMNRPFCESCRIIEEKKDWVNKVTKKLKNNGLSDDEVKARIAELERIKKRKLNKTIKKRKYGHRVMKIVTYPDYNKLI